MTNAVAPYPPDSTPLATLLQLGSRARAAGSMAELRFLLVNETHALVPYRQAALWLARGGVAALSGVVSPEANAPYVHWLKRWFTAKTAVTGSSHSSADAMQDAAPQSVDLSTQPDTDWADWLPQHTLTLPLPATNGFAGGQLLLARDTPFDAAETALLQEWAAIWSATAALRTGRTLFGASRRGSSPRRVLRSVLPLLVVAVVAALSLLPVRLSVLAPAELIPLQPAVVRAPLDGVVERILVQPNQRVASGEPLFEFDRVSLSSRLQVAQRALATIQAEYRQRAQRALFDPDSKAQLAVLQSQIDERSVEVRYLRALNERGVAMAPRAGVVLFDDPGQWVGRPVVTGERIMVVADETQVQIEAWLAPADRIDLRPGATVRFFSAADPTRPVEGRLAYIGHEAQLRPEGQYAYRLRATLDAPSAAGSSARVGLKGTAKIEGPQVSAFYWVVRKPWAALRGWLGV